MTTFNVPDMSCGHCRSAITKAVHGLDPAARIDFDMEARRISVESVAETARVQSALTEAGYPATPS
jgi:copper chaperone CopZ